MPLSGVERLQREARRGKAACRLHSGGSLLTLRGTATLTRTHVYTQRHVHKARGISPYGPCTHSRYCNHLLVHLTVISEDYQQLYFLSPFPDKLWSRFFLTVFLPSYNFNIFKKERSRQLSNWTRSRLLSIRSFFPIQTLYHSHCLPDYHCLPHHHHHYHTVTITITTSTLNDHH